MKREPQAAGNRSAMAQLERRNPLGGMLRMDEETRLNFVKMAEMTALLKRHFDELIAFDAH